MLARPDGHVAWRTAAAAVDPAALLHSAVDAALGRPAALAGEVEDVG